MENTMVLTKLNAPMNANEIKKVVLNFVSKSLMQKIMIVAIAISIAFAGTNYTAKAQPPNPPPDDPGTLFIQADHQGQIRMGGCIITYNYWYRCAFGIHRDVFIDGFTMEGDCPFDPTWYKTIFDAIMADIVGSEELWHDPPCPGADIPICESGITPSTPWTYRFFRPACFSEPITVWENGNFVKKSVQCQDGGGYCFTLYRYCWREVPNPDPPYGTMLMLVNETMPGGVFWPAGPQNCPDYSTRSIMIANPDGKLKVNEPSRAPVKCYPTCD